MNALKVGIIGGGGIAGAHGPYLKSRDDVELVALADVNEAAGRASAERFGIAQVFTDYRELIPHVDAVLVCVPTWLHSEVAIAALEAGRAVFCEKPMARTLQQADAMLQAAKKADHRLQLGFVRRFDAEWLAWGEAVQAEKIGRPVVWRDLAAFEGPSAPWYNQDELGGGPFLDGCIHNLDFALMTFGRAKWAFCHGRTLNPTHTAIDTGTATVRFQSGDELLLAWSWGLPAGVSGTRVFEVFGPQGIISWPKGEAAQASEGKTVFVVNNGENSERIESPQSALGDAFDAQMDEFIAVARGEKSPRAGGQQGRDALAVALAILESARSEQVVHL